MVYAKHPLFFPGVWNFSTKLHRGGLRNQPPMSFPGRQHLHRLSQFVVGGIKYILGDSISKGLGGLGLISSGLAPHVPFPFADFVWHLFAITDLSCEFQPYAECCEYF